MRKSKGREWLVDCIIYPFLFASVIVAFIMLWTPPVVQWLTGQETALSLDWFWIGCLHLTWWVALAAWKPVRLLARKAQSLLARSVELPPGCTTRMGRVEDSSQPTIVRLP